MLIRVALLVLFSVNLIVTVNAAIIVAPSTALPEEKAKANIICDGKDDQVELLESIKKAKKYDVVVDMTPASQQTVNCYGKHSVVWLAGDYNLSQSLEIPNAADLVVNAEGSCFNFLPAEGAAVIVRGMNRCRYNFGTIKTNTSGAAILVQPQKGMPSLMSYVTFMGLIGTGQKGIGLHLDHRHENVCVNNFVGTDIYGFDIGVLVDDVTETQSENRPTAKSDTNWYWFSYIRLCNTCIWEKHHGVDSGHWEVNVDASLPGSTAIRTAATYSTWRIIMGQWSREKTHALILDPAAQHQIIEMTPPIDGFTFQDSSGNDTNVILSTTRPPLRP